MLVSTADLGKELRLNCMVGTKAASGASSIPFIKELPVVLVDFKASLVESPSLGEGIESFDLGKESDFFAAV